MKENRESDGDQPKSESGEGGPSKSAAFKQQVSSAFAVVVSLVATVGGVAGLVGEFTKSPKEQVVLALLSIAGLVLLVLGVRALINSHGTKVNASVGLLSLVVAGAVAIGVVGGLVFSHTDTPRTSPVASPSVTATRPSQVPPATSAPSATVPCSRPLTITSPASGTKIVGSVGVTVDISACGLAPGDTGWLFDVDSGDGTYGLDGDGGPIVTANGATQFDDSPVGTAGDQNEQVTLTLVLADSACTTSLDAINFQTTYPTSLPASCQIESQVEVIETY